MINLEEFFKYTHHSPLLLLHERKEFFITHMDLSHVKVKFSLPNILPINDEEFLWKDNLGKFSSFDILSHPIYKSNENIHLEDIPNKFFGLYKGYSSHILILYIIKDMSFTHLSYVKEKFLSFQNISIYLKELWK